MMRQQSSNDFDVEEEFQNALDEIKKNEKEISMIANIANTLFEKMEEAQMKL